MKFSKNEMQPKKLQTPNEKSARLRLKCGMFQMKVIKNTTAFVLYWMELKVLTFLWSLELLNFISLNSSMHLFLSGASCLK